jgi:hypothetical protein
VSSEVNDAMHGCLILGAKILVKNKFFRPIEPLLSSPAFFMFKSFLEAEDKIEPPAVGDFVRMILELYDAEKVN